MLCVLIHWLHWGCIWNWFLCECSLAYIAWALHYLSHATWIRVTDIGKYFDLQSVACTQNCRWAWLFVLCNVDSWGSIHREWSKHLWQPTYIDTGQFWCYLMQFISSKIWCECCAGIVELPGWTIHDSELSQWNPLHWFTSTLHNQTFVLNSTESS
jgi:hypothetical protein